MHGLIFLRSNNMKKVILVTGALVLSACSYFLPQNNQTLYYQCGTTPLTAALDAKASEVSFLLGGELLHQKEGLALSITMASTLSNPRGNAHVECNGRVMISDCVQAN